jgi:hypothetical protein
MKRFFILAAALVVGVGACKPRDFNSETESAVTKVCPPGYTKQKATETQRNIIRNMKIIAPDADPRAHYLVWFTADSRWEGKKQDLEKVVKNLNKYSKEQQQGMYVFLDPQFGSLAALKKSEVRFFAPSHLDGAQWIAAKFGGLKVDSNVDTHDVSCAYDWATLNTLEIWLK